jgi:cytochrome b involved in lipid metabolism
MGSIVRFLAQNLRIFSFEIFLNKQNPLGMESILERMWISQYKGKHLSVKGKIKQAWQPSYKAGWGCVVQ